MGFQLRFAINPESWHSWVTSPRGRGVGTRHRSLQGLETQREGRVFEIEMLGHRLGEHRVGTETRETSD